MAKVKCSCGAKLRITGTFALGGGGEIANFLPRPTGERMCENGHLNMLGGSGDQRTAKRVELALS